MIALTFVHPDTGLDTVWNVSLKSHSPFLEKRKTATADAGDYIAPDVHYKGAYDMVQLVSNPLEASAEIANFYLFRRGTRKGRPIEVAANMVPVIGTDYVAQREGDMVPKGLHGDRYFSFVLTLRILSTD